PGQERRRGQAPDPVAVVLERVVLGQAMPAAAGPCRDRDGAEAVAEAIADERPCAPRLGRRERPPCAVASREKHWVAHGTVVDEHTPPAAAAGELQDGNLACRPRGKI